MTLDLLSIDVGSGAIAAVTRRYGGVSEAPFDSLNMSFRFDQYGHMTRQDMVRNQEQVMNNRVLVADALGMQVDRWVVGKLVHGSDVAVVTEAHAGRGARSFEMGLPAVDALVTDVSDLPLVVLVADCAPVLFHDPVRRAIGVAHAGYRGAIDGVAANTVAAMVENYGCNPANIRVVVGPCLGPQSLEMQNAEIVAEAVSAHGPSASLTGPAGTPHLDVPEMVRSQVMATGVPKPNIDLTDIDVAGGQEFFSFRSAEHLHYDETDPTKVSRPTGRFAAIVTLL